MPKIVDHDLYRAELLGKCLPIFVRKGVSSVSMRELSKELGVSTGTLYHYFPTKEALFGSMVKQLVAADAKEIAELSESQVGLSGILEFVSKRESHFINLILLTIDVKRELPGAIDLMSQVEESFRAYQIALDQFFPKMAGTGCGAALFSFLVGALFLKANGTNNLTWEELFGGLESVAEQFFEKTKTS
ncbi:TetR/AcrR family transcriptional regulator [Leptospira sp. 96542]|nr:TetR/AcrR family transcriptional regulator [Leptospira sp. 96542]